MATTVQTTRQIKGLTFALARPAMRVCLLIFGDMASLFLAVLFAFWYWSIVNPTIPRQHSAMYLVVALSIAAFALHGLYPGIGLNAVQHLRRIFRSITFSYLLLTASMVLVKDWWVNSRGGFFLSWIVALLFVPLGRWLLNHLFGRKTWWGAPVIVLGAGQTAGVLIRNLRDNRVLAYQPVFCLDDDPARQGECEGVPVLGCLNDATVLAQQYQIHHAIVAMPTMSRNRLMEHLRVWSRVFPYVLIVPDLVGIGSMWVEPHDLGGVLSLELRHQLLNPFNQAVKRATDVILACIGIVIATPIILLAAAWIWLISRGSPFYRQQREGRGGKTIHILKLRTMHPDAETMLRRHLDENPQAKAEWDQFCKLRNDPRILPGVGHFLRRTSLDELPQLINILRGDMSLVGPRPFPAYHNERFDEDFRALRLQVTPGLTGLWQMKARSDGNLDVQAALDSYYVRNWSLWLDLYILARTARVLVNRSGAY